RPAGQGCRPAPPARPAPATVPGSARRAALPPGSATPGDVRAASESGTERPAPGNARDAPPGSTVPHPPDAARHTPRPDPGLAPAGAAGARGVPPAPRDVRDRRNTPSTIVRVPRPAARIGPP